MQIVYKIYFLNDIIFYSSTCYTMAFAYGSNMIYFSTNYTKALVFCMHMNA
jgi:hypothetical protein